MTPHPQLVAYLQRQGLPADRVGPDGRLTLTLADRARLAVQPLPGGGLLFEGRVAPLPAAGPRRTQRIDTLLRAGAQRLRNHPQALVIDAQADAVLLQQRVSEGLSPVDFDDQVERFLKAVVFFKHVEGAS